MIVNYLAQAQVDLIKIVEYYEQQRVGVGREFRSEIEFVVQRIQRDATSFPILEGKLRFVVLKKFPYYVLFECQSEREVLVVAIAHGSREPGYWRDRL